MLGKTTTISRDPFARIDYIRRTVETDATCAFCGQKRKGGKRLYQYGHETDSGRQSWDRSLFDSWQCRNSYY